MAQKTNYLESKAEKAKAVTAAVALKRDEQARKVELEQIKLAEIDRKVEKLAEGMARDLSKYELETDEQRRKREFGNEIRKWHREIRVELSGRRLAINNPSNAVNIFDLIYSKWKRHNCPAAGVVYTIDSLLKSTKMSRRTLLRELGNLKRRGILGGKQAGRRGGKGGREEARYGFPTFPDRGRFEEVWTRTWD